MGKSLDEKDRVSTRSLLAPSRVELEKLLVELGDVTVGAVEDSQEELGIGVVTFNVVVTTEGVKKG